jgi:hypothetical protein
MTTVDQRGIRLKEERMTTLKGGSSELLPHSGPHGGEVAITAVELARMASVTAADIHYWGKSNYLSKRTGSSPFPLSQLPKAQLMGIFAKQLHMDAGNASKLAEQLLPVYARRPDVVAALKTLAEVVESRIDGLARLLVETDLVPQLSKILESKHQEEEAP